MRAEQSAAEPRKSALERASESERADARRGAAERSEALRWVPFKFIKEATKCERIKGFAFLLLDNIETSCNF